MKITFKGNYSGTKTLYFTIKPKSTSISSLSAGSKKFTVKWKKQSTQTTGYQVQYSTSSKFKRAKTVTVSKNSTTSETISKLKSKKKYYVRVRTYKVVNGTKYYSSWSKVKSVKTK
ncbi:MAG: fibronectin type III domain-containing protein [Eubacterium sp.]